MVIRLYSGGLEGVDAFPVEVEVDYVRRGLPGFSLVGLAETEVREARDRVFAALRACNFRLPPARITVNLASRTSVSARPTRLKPGRPRRT